MRRTKARYQLRQVMLVIAVLAGLFGAVGVVRAIAIVLVVGLLWTPIRLAGPRRRMHAAAWVACAYPLFVLGSLYATWVTAWLVLGHRPRWSLDDPRSIGLVVEVPYVSTRLLGQGLPLILLFWAPLTLADTFVDAPLERKHPSRGPGRMFVWILVTLSTWGGSFAILWWNLLGAGSVFHWYFD